MIRFDNISKHFASGCEALSQINFCLGSGEMAFLTGHSGAGKSTLLKLIMLIDKPSKGQLQVGNHHLERLSNSQIPTLRRHIGMIFQNPQLLPDKTVFDNVALPLVIEGYRTSDIKRRVRAALDKVGLLAKENYYPDEISGGQQQRVGIARAVVKKPKVILADEPTGNLDPLLSEEIMMLFSEFREVGTTLLIATHDIALIERLPYRRLTLDKGKLVHDTAYG